MGPLKQRMSFLAICRLGWAVAVQIAGFSLDKTTIHDIMRHAHCSAVSIHIS